MVGTSGERTQNTGQAQAGLTGAWLFKECVFKEVGLRLTIELMNSSASHRPGWCLKTPVGVEWGGPTGCQASRQPDAI